MNEMIDLFSESACVCLCAVAVAVVSAFSPIHSPRNSDLKNNRKSTIETQNKGDPALPPFNLCTFECIVLAVSVYILKPFS